jgi:hypothetical protein
VYFVHQSAKDFLFEKASHEVFPNGAEDIHRGISLTSLAYLSTTLHRDMYSLKAPGRAVENVKPPHADPLAASRYPCVYWIDHLHDSKPESWANSVANLPMRAVYKFLRDKYLYWLEALSLCHSVGKGVVSMEKLWPLVQVCRTRSTCLQFNLNASTSRRCVTKIDLFSLFKTHGGLLCTTKAQSRATLFRRMHPHCCSARQVV